MKQLPPCKGPRRDSRLRSCSAEGSSNLLSWTNMDADTGRPGIPTTIHHQDSFVTPSTDNHGASSIRATALPQCERRPSYWVETPPLPILQDGLGHDVMMYFETASDNNPNAVLTRQLRRESVLAYAIPLDGETPISPLTIGHNVPYSPITIIPQIYVQDRSGSTRVISPTRLVRVSPQQETFRQDVNAVPRNIDNTAHYNNSEVAPEGRTTRLPSTRHSEELEITRLLQERKMSTEFTKEYTTPLIVDYQQRKRVLFEPDEIDMIHRGIRQRLERTPKTYIAPEICSAFVNSVIDGIYAERAKKNKNKRKILPKAPPRIVPERPAKRRAGRPRLTGEQIIARDQKKRDKEEEEAAIRHAKYADYMGTGPNLAAYNQRCDSAGDSTDTSVSEPADAADANKPLNSNTNLGKFTKDFNPYPETTSQKAPSVLPSGGAAPAAQHSRDAPPGQLSVDAPLGEHRHIAPEVDVCANAFQSTATHPIQLYISQGRVLDTSADSTSALHPTKTAFPQVPVLPPKFMLSDHVPIKDASSKVSSVLQPQPHSQPSMFGERIANNNMPPKAKSSAPEIVKDLFRNCGLLPLKPEETRINTENIQNPWFDNLCDSQLTGQTVMVSDDIALQNPENYPKNHHVNYRITNSTNIHNTTSGNAVSHSAERGDSGSHPLPSSNSKDSIANSLPTIIQTSEEDNSDEMISDEHHSTGDFSIFDGDTCKLMVSPHSTPGSIFPSWDDAFSHVAPDANRSVRNLPTEAPSLDMANDAEELFASLFKDIHLDQTLLPSLDQPYGDLFLPQQYTEHNFQNASVSSVAGNTKPENGTSGNTSTTLNKKDGSRRPEAQLNTKEGPMMDQLSRDLNDLSKSAGWKKREEFKRLHKEMSTHRIPGKPV